jgi:hypothetical protein
MNTFETCSHCKRVLLWIHGRLICANVHCTAGHDAKKAAS